MKKRVIVVRKDLFKFSEPFIADQAAAFSSWQPVFVGDNLSGPVPEWAEVILTKEKAKLSKLLEEPNVETIVYSHFAIDAVLGMRLAVRARAPHVVVLHGFDITRSRKNMLRSGRPNLVRFVLAERRLIRKVDLFLPVSNYLASVALARGIDSEKLLVHHMGIPSPASRPSARTPLLISHVGRLVEKKGTIDLVHAVARLRDQGLDCQLEVIGEGPLKQGLVTLTEELGLRSRVRFLGPRSHTEVLELIARSSVFCLPSKAAANGDSEGLGMVLLEAAALETPIIASDSGGITDFVRDGNTGMVVRAGDRNDIAVALRKLLTDSQAGKELTSNALELVKEGFDVNTQTKMLEALFERASRNYQVRKQ